MSENMVSLKSIIDDLQQKGQIPIGYASFRQAYLQGKVSNEVMQFVVNVKKFSSISYYVEEPKVEKFSEALIKQFNVN